MTTAQRFPPSWARRFTGWLGVLVAGLWFGVQGQDASVLPGTELLTSDADLSVQMVQGIDRFLMREIGQSLSQRARAWQRDFSSAAAYEAAIATNRQRLAQRIGVDPGIRNPPVLEFLENSVASAKLVATDKFNVFAVRWQVLPGVHGEGLLLRPKDPAAAGVVVIPDADQTPEQLVGLSPGLPPKQQLARQLAASGFEVIVLTLIDRRDEWSGIARLGRFTNQPHREWIYRQAYELGRHIIGYEVEKALAAARWLANPDPAATPGGADSRRPSPRKVGLAGYGEGGLIALYAAALDPAVDATLVSGYFDSRQGLWEEPIYRNVFGLLAEFGDAEVASLIAPRGLLIEYSEVPRVDGPPVARPGRAGAAPGRLQTPAFHIIEAEYDRALAFFPQHAKPPFLLIRGNEGSTLGPFSAAARRELLARMGLKAVADEVEPPLIGEVAGLPARARERQQRQVEELVEHNQRLLRECEENRKTNFWAQLKPSSPDDWRAQVAGQRIRFGDEVIGRFPPPSVPTKPRSRRILDEPRWSGYEVVLEVWPDVFAWGCLLVPKGMKPGERRPVVVCQHGLEGLPAHTINGPGKPGYDAYKAYAARLADEGFITFAPHNPYRGGDSFRVLQRKANPIGRSLFSIITGQHGRILEWLASQPFVDPKRIAFYGLSYGGKTAMRVPALLEGYCLSICSADFNEWIRKNATADSAYSYLLTGEYEMPEFDLARTFSYAEMAALIAPRPFMVERGHHDGVAPDEWVAYEYAKVRRLYAQLEIPERTAIEFFNGPHTINGMGTFDFLRKHLRWPEPPAP